MMKQIVNPKFYMHGPKKMNFNLNLILYIKINLEWSMDLNVKYKSIKLTGKYRNECWTRFLRLDPKSMIH